MHTLITFMAEPKANSRCAAKWLVVLILVNARAWLSPTKTLPDALCLRLSFSDSFRGDRTMFGAGGIGHPCATHVVRASRVATGSGDGFVFSPQDGSLWVPFEYQPKGGPPF